MAEEMSESRQIDDKRENASETVVKTHRWRQIWLAKLIYCLLNIVKICFCFLDGR